MATAGGCAQSAGGGGDGGNATGRNDARSRSCISNESIIKMHLHDPLNFKSRPAQLPKISAALRRLSTSCQMEVSMMSNRLKARLKVVIKTMQKAKRDTRRHCEPRRCIDHNAVDGGRREAMANERRRQATAASVSRKDDHARAPCRSHPRLDESLLSATFR